MRGFIDHAERATLRDLECGQFAVGLDAEHCVDRTIDHLLGLGLLPFSVGIEAALVLLAQPMIFEQAINAGGRRHARAERFRQDMTDLIAHVDADFVQQGEWADRKAPRHQRLVDTLDRHAFGEQVRGLAQVRAEDARGIKTRTVIDHDHGFALAFAERHASRRDPRRGGRSDHYLEQRHLVHGREVMHPDHVLGAPRALCDASDRQRRSIGSEDRVLPRAVFALGQYLALQVQVLEHGFDHQIHRVEAVIVRGRGQARHGQVHAHVDLCLSDADISDARTHQARAQLCDTMHGSRFRRSRLVDTVSFFDSLLAKKTCISARACSLTTSSPNAFASAASPRSSPSAIPSLTTSRMRSGAG